MKPKDYPALARKLTSYWGSWPVSRPIEVGDIGIVNSAGAFVRVTDLGKIPQLPKPAISSRQSALYDMSSQHVDVQFGVKAAAGAQAAEARAKITFSHAGSALIILDRPTYRQVRDITMLKRQILALLDDGWEQDWIVVVETVSADGVTVLVSGERNAAIEFGVSAQPGGLLLGDLAKAGIDLAVRHRKRIGMAAFGEKGTPLYRTLRVRKTFLGRTQAELSGGTAVPNEAFEDVPLPDMDT
ncbi:hypothetical protein [Amycolatopsis sp. NPDC004625]|uniref:hypothetical protein n=1 Tax=Amycolatopsis sp. NPDC004625 TaxID=3154670 RepID=UPI0033BB780A